MKIVFTGGGTGGHFFPLIAVAEEVKDIINEEKLLPIKLYYFSDAPYDKRALYENNIKFIQVPTGKRRLYGGIANFFDLFKIATGCFIASIKLFFVFPDVVFSKGGYAAFPTVFAAKILGIPVILHESDTVPGRVNLWAAKFAKKIAIAQPQAARFFAKEKVALVGIPIRKQIKEKANQGVFEFFSFDPTVPTILILGGSSGAEIINDTIIDALPSLVQKYQIIHQVGIKNKEDVVLRSQFLLEKSEFKNRYKLFDLLNPLEMKMAAGAATIIITRAGATSLAEIALWGLPSIVVPIPEEVSRDQKTNAFEYARTGAATVIEQQNLSSSIILSELERLTSNSQKLSQMSLAAKNNASPNAGKIIAQELIRIVLSHQNR